jgi:hypothetical protein
MRHVGRPLALLGGALVVASFFSNTLKAHAQEHLVGFDDVRLWAGGGAKRAALVIDWNDGKPNESLLWGFRWDGTATGEDLFRAIDAADPRLFLDVKADPMFGNFLDAIGYDADGDGFSTADPDDHYHAGFELGNFWSYFTFESTPFGPGGWAESNVGFSIRTLADGSWDGWSWDSFPADAPGEPVAAVAAPVPEPAPALLIAGAVGAVALLRRRGPRAAAEPVAQTFLSVPCPRAGASLPPERARELPAPLARTPERTGMSAQNRQECLFHRAFARPTPQVLVSALTLAALPTFASPFATQVVSSTGLNATGLYDDPASVLGKPTTRFDGSFGGAPDPHRAKLIEGIFNYGPGGPSDKLLTTISAGQQVTVRFDHRVEDDPANPFGLDLIVFGNAFFGGTAGSGFPSETTNLNTFTLAGSLFAEPMKVSVSQDGLNFVTFDAGPFADGLFPTNAYRWDRAAARWTDEEADFTKPVNPTLRPADFAGKSAADALDLYNGSAGGTGFDLAAIGLPWIEYVRVEGTTGFAGGEIDAFADVAPVPEPAGVAMVAVAGVLLCRRRRRR